MGDTGQIYSSYSSLEMEISEPQDAKDVLTKIKSLGDSFLRRLGLWVWSARVSSSPPFFLQQIQGLEGGVGGSSC